MHQQKANNSDRPVPNYQDLDCICLTDKMTVDKQGQMHENATRQNCSKCWPLTISMQAKEDSKGNVDSQPNKRSIYNS